MEWKTIRAPLLTCIFDLVSKAPIVNMNQFSGKYSCLTCTRPGSTYSRGCHIYNISMSLINLSSILMFDVQQTLQLVYPLLSKHENPETIEFLKDSKCGDSK